MKTAVLRAYREPLSLEEVPAGLSARVPGPRGGRELPALRGRGSAFLRSTDRQVPAALSLSCHAQCPLEQLNHLPVAGLQGVDAEARDEITPLSVGDALLNGACDFGADLIVMGAYGHARWAERLFGGVSRTVLQSMTVPVLMSH